VNAHGARFCGECGQGIASDRGILSPASAERRQLTVMFCDLVGSTELSVRLDPEELREVIAAYRACCAETARRFGGFVAQYLGDGVLLYFGYPQAHEADAERAVRAGLAMVTAVEALPRPDGSRLRARVGIATGLTVVGAQVGISEVHERTAVGETPNLAARLQALAAPGEVVIAVTTRRLVGQLFDCETLGTVALKGLAPVEAWRVVGESRVLSRFEALHGTNLTPFVWREEEMALLARRWEQVKGGGGRVVLLSGEPGIGKSRLSETLVAQVAAKPAARLRYFCSPHHTQSAFHPFIAQLERAAGFAPADNARARLAKLATLLAPTSADPARELALIAELLSLPAEAGYVPLEASPQDKRELILAALLAQLERLAAQAPVLLVFEDAHWIDPTSLDLLGRTVARVADLPVLLVVTFRPEFQPPWVSRAHVTTLSLSRLGGHDAARIIDGVARGQALPPEIAQQILERTDGVPLFIEELTSTVLESGLLRDDGGRLRASGALPVLAVPTTLQASLVSRLDRLASVKDVAQIGATIGREFSYALLKAVAALGDAALRDALGRLTASGLVQQRGSPPEALYTFKHALVQDAAYGTLLKSRRQQLHATIAADGS
jgi:class 3 adenylate cyclase